MAPIRSVYVPKGMVLKVEYEAGRAEGAFLILRSEYRNDHKFTYYKQSIECVEDVEHSKQPRVHLSN